MRKIIVEYHGFLYGEPEILRRDFANVLRSFGFEVIEDVEIPELKEAPNPQGMEEYCKEKDMTLVVFWVREIPFYYAVKEPFKGHLLDHLNLIRETKIEKEEE